MQVAVLKYAAEFAAGLAGLQFASGSVTPTGSGASRRPRSKAVQRPKRLAYLEALSHCKSLNLGWNTADARTTAISAEDLALLYATMDAHIGSAELQKTALDTLASLCCNPANANRIGTPSGGIARVFAAMDVQLWDLSVQSSACYALWAIAQFSEHGRESLLAGGCAEERINRAKHKYPSPGREGVRTWASVVLGVLARGRSVAGQRREGKVEDDDETDITKGCAVM